MLTQGVEERGRCQRRLRFHSYITGRIVKLTRDHSGGEANLIELEMPKEQDGLVQQAADRQM